MFNFTLTVTEIATGKVVHIEEYKNFSNTAMMDEQKHLHLTKYPRASYRIDW